MGAIILQHQVYITKTMKTYFQISALILLGSVSALAQNSPHNYKRPVFQQNTHETSNITVEQNSSDKYKIQPLNASVHNYKRQGSIDLGSEVKFAFSVPKLQPSSLNPLVSPGHYKLHNIANPAVSVAMKPTKILENNETK